jgi:hypothetical protein
MVTLMSKLSYSDMIGRQLQGDQPNTFPRAAICEDGGSAQVIATIEDLDFHNSLMDEEFVPRRDLSLLGGKG